MKDSTAIAGPDAGRPDAGQPRAAAAEEWEAIVERNGSFNGLFVYGVRTTGIYCRPSCPARRPLPEHVVIFGAPAEAEAGGFRPCRRCNPQSAEGTPGERAIARARAYIDQHLDEPITLATLAAQVGLSPSHLLRSFRRIVGLSPKGYHDARRLENFKTQVRNGETVLEATFGAGFGSSRSLYERAVDGLGMTPGAYRRGGRGLRITFTTLGSPFGEILIAATERGVCAILLGDRESELEAALADEFPHAAIERDDAGLDAWGSALLGYLEGTGRPIDLPLDPQGTEFQRRVWSALREIPYGGTRSYGEVAAMIGEPTASRAVAGACASNRVALLIPCHRVLPRDGTPGGYRWGKERKRLLLELERCAGDDPEGAGLDPTGKRPG